MSLLDDIIEMTADDKVPIGALLRSCLVLENQVKNEKFKAWLDRELDGYDVKEELPSYRVFDCINKGLFVGNTMQLNDQPIPTHLMEEGDRKIVEKAFLHQPAASYEADKPTNAIKLWPPDLTAKYQTRFFQHGHPILNRAWQELPGSVLISLLEQVRTRVLRFALELRDNLPPETADAEKVPASVVERSVVNNIYGGNILIASHTENVSQITHTNIALGDTSALTQALSQLGITPHGIAQLEQDIEADKKNGEPSVGPKIRGWLAQIGQYLSKEGAKAGVDVAKRLATKWILQHYGLDLG
jgi:hypothetical protein